MMIEVEKILEEKGSLEREYLEVLQISGEMSLTSEAHDKMIMSNIAHSLSVIADALAGREIKPQTEEKTGEN